MYIGIDLGGTNIAAGLVDKTGTILEQGSVPTKPERGAKAVVSDMVSLARALVEKAGCRPEEIEWIGIGSPGSVDKEKGEVIFSGNLMFDHTPLRQMTSRLWELPVYLENDANCAALGEVVAGTGREMRHVVMVTLGTGLGGGIVIDRKIYSGFNGGGGELGHVVIEHGGRACTCGRKGCWEAYSSATALVAFTREAMQADARSLLWQTSGGRLDGVSGRTAFQAAQKGDKAAAGVVQKYIEYLGCGIANVINIFQPDAVLLGGGVANEGDGLMVPLMKVVERGRFPAGEKKTKVLRASLGNRAGIIGAAMLGT